MKPFLQTILAQIEQLEPFPWAAIRVLELSLGSDPDPLEIARVVEADVGLNAKVLKLANNVLSSTVRTIGSVSEACVRLGTRSVAGLALTSSTSNLYRGYGKAEQTDRLWKFSLATALACRTIAESDGCVDAHRAYTAGLLQNMGSILLDRFLAVERDEIEALVASGAMRIAAEHHVLGTDHASIGGQMAQRWLFPFELVDTIRCHHAPSQAVVDPRLCHIAELAESVAEAALGGTESRDVEPLYPERWINITATDLARIRRELPARLAERAHSVDR